MNGIDATDPTPLVNGDVASCDTLKAVLGGESLCVTSVTKGPSVKHIVSFITTPDETDIGALGCVVDKTGTTTGVTG